MKQPRPYRIASISENPDPDWCWLRDLMGAEFRVGTRALEWRSFSTSPECVANSGLLRFLCRRLPSASRWLGARQLRAAHKENPFDLIVSHGPWVSAWTESVIASSKAPARHLAYSFNFTDLPHGVRKRLMGAAFGSIDAFAAFTDFEIKLYANHFGIPLSRFTRAPWGVATPITHIKPRLIDAPYAAALGGEARDYETLCKAAALCPDQTFIVVARPKNFQRLSPPPNMRVLFNLPFEDAWSVVANAGAAILPLRASDTPCGIVSLVGAMHLGKAQIVSAAPGVREYVEDGQTALVVPPVSPQALANAVKKLTEDPNLAARLGANAKTIAKKRYNEEKTVQFFKALLNDWSKAGDVAAPDLPPERA